MRFVHIVAVLGFLASAIGGMAQDQNDRRLQNTISVTGNGESNTAPDIAYVSVGVVTTGKRAQDAAQANATSTQKVMAGLRQLGIAKRDLQTSNYSVNPTYEPQPRANP